MSDRTLVGAMAALLVMTIAAGLGLIWSPMSMILDPHRVQKTYYIPSQSMLPTLAVGDRFRPLRVDRLQRGQIIIFRLAGEVRVSRLIGLSGDTVTLKGGQVILSGRPATYRRLGPGPTVNETGTTELAEQLPDRSGEHTILDAGPSPQDDVPPLRIPGGRLFVLGDDRDFTADSRISPGQGGAGLVARADVIGIVDRLLWSRGFKDRGKPVR